VCSVLKLRYCPLTQRADVIGFNEIFEQLSQLTLAVYAALSYVQPSRLSKYEEIYDPDAEIGHGSLKQIGREKGIQALMTVNLLKRLESSVHSFRLTLQSLADTRPDKRRPYLNFLLASRIGFQPLKPPIAPPCRAITRSRHADPCRTASPLLFCVSIELRKLSF
jgi:hypothetical protein